MKLGLLLLESTTPNYVNISTVCANGTNPLTVWSLSDIIKGLRPAISRYAFKNAARSHSAVDKDDLEQTAMMKLVSIIRNTNQFDDRTVKRWISQAKYYMLQGERGEGSPGTAKYIQGAYVNRDGDWIGVRGTKSSLSPETSISDKPESLATDYGQTDAVDDLDDFYNLIKHGSFSDNEIKILKLLVGVDGEKLSASEIATKLGVSGARISQLRTKIQKKLSDAMFKRDLERKTASKATPDISA